MEQEYFLFPYEKINSGDRVILYGIGVIGRCYLSQIESNRYCEIVAVADRKSAQYSSSLVKVISPSEIKKYNYDKVVITVKNRIEAAKIKKELYEKYDILEDKIIVAASESVPAVEKSQMACFTVKKDEVVCQDAISIAMIISGGLGDQIINKHFLYAMLSYANLEKCVVDLYVSPARYKFAKSIFGDKKNINEIFSRTVYPQELSDYDVVFRYDYVLKFYRINLDKICLLDQRFYYFLKNAKDYIQKYGLDADNPLHRNIHFSRCRVLGYNCYTNYSELFDNKIENKVEITVDKKFEAEFNNINLDRYITINYGWGGHRDSFPDKIPNKVWEIDRYSEFNRLFHAAFPGIKIVQIGIQGGAQIDDVDYYLFGKDLELVKYALRDSILHVDCEGGLVHLATQLGTKCVVLFGPTPIHYFGYKDNINIMSGVCCDCYYLYNDFSVCARGLNHPECMKSITAQMVMDKVTEYMK